MSKLKIMYADEEFSNKIINWIHEKRKESKHLDYKRCWESKNSELIKDIFSFANTYDNKDSYLVYGVTDDKKHICGVNDDPNRKNQSKIINLLDSLKISGDEIPPQIKVRTINYESSNHNKKLQIDVLIIKNDYNVPVYLDKKYKKSRQGTLKSNIIYSRQGSVDDVAKFGTIKSLWKKRFGIGLTLHDKYSKALKDYKHWHCYEIDNQGPIFIYDFDSNLEIITHDKVHTLNDNDIQQNLIYPISIMNIYLGLNPNVFSSDLYLEYNHTPISSYKFNYTINNSGRYRYVIIKPNIRPIRIGSNTPTIFYYYNYNNYLINRVIFNSYNLFNIKRYLDDINPINSYSIKILKNNMKNKQSKINKQLKMLIIPLLTRNKMNGFCRWFNSGDNITNNIYRESVKHTADLNNITSQLGSHINSKDIKRIQFEYLSIKYYKKQYKEWIGEGCPMYHK